MIHTYLINDINETEEEKKLGVYRKDGQIFTSIWQCKCGRDYITIYEPIAADSMDFSCKCGEYIKKICRIDDDRIETTIHEGLTPGLCKICGKKGGCNCSFHAAMREGNWS